MQYTDRLFRPPAEADSLIFQVALGCPHNTCRFCAMYKGVPYRMQPRLLSALRFVDVPGTDMADGFQTVTEREAVGELIRLLRGLTLEKTVFRANHTSNPVPLEGRLPKDRDALVALLESLLPRLDARGPGRLPFSL